MGEYKADTNFVLNGRMAEPSTTLDFSVPQPYKPSSNFDFTGVQGQPSTNFDFGGGSVEVTAVYPIGSDFLRTGYPLLYSGSKIVKPPGVFAPDTGLPTIINTAEQVKQKETGLQTVYGLAKIYNLKTIVNNTGFTSFGIGSHYLQGGVKQVEVKGLLASLFGKTVALNTTEDRSLLPRGINDSNVGRPIVSPTFIYATGWRVSKVGVPDVRKPQLLPQGATHTKYGSATIWYHTRGVAPNGVSAYDTGYARVYDPAQTIQVSSLITSAVFGDTNLKNVNSYIKPEGLEQPAISPWSSVVNNNRYIALTGIASLVFGDSYTRNKTPSIFIQGIKQPLASQPAVGYRLRSIKPSGFDRLSIGGPSLTKTPELNPQSFDSLKIGTQFISHRIRVIDSNERGIFAFSAGTPIVWFYARSILLNGWVSEKIGGAVATHEVREVIAKGFTKEVFSNPWLSRAVRSVQAISIYQEFATRHNVGFSQSIKPVGYVATLFGTRIIPDSRAVYPLGFIGKWGLSSIGLYTRYLKPQGYISFGKQPADRWGWALAYNSVQYVVQRYDSGNGLVPPKWSEWTAIENRNKQVSATGLNSLRFGYNKIDNNARQLLPKGVQPKDIAGGMIAQARRSVSLNGIEPIIIGSWSVVFNTARVIAPTGATHTAAGQLATVINNRRYYLNYGRIDSMVMGAPAISHRIRSIDIEKRYSIAPPQINLPTIDLLTKYIEPRGYSLENYGAPVFDIRFNIIAPKWVHRNNLGEGYVRNLTPEIGVYGHNSELFGINSVRTQWRKVYTAGSTLSVFGLSKIADTRRSIIVAGWRDTVVAQKHTAVRMGAPLYSEQKISLDGWFDYATDKYREGDGIDSEKTVSANGKLRVPKPFINQNVLYAEGYVASLWGDNRIWSNNIMIDAGIAIHNISANNIVRHKNRVITLTEDHAIESSIEVGEPRLSPWTIWATTEAPAQAKQNHVRSALRLHAIDGLRVGGSTANFGNPKVDSTIRTIYQKPPLTTKRDAFGEAVLQLRTRIIAPPSFRRSAVGMPSMPFTLQSVTMFEQSLPMTVYGQSVVKHINNGPILINATGLNSSMIGLGVSIDHRDRLVKPIGYSALTMGSKKNNDNPYMWQGLRVGAHVPLVIGGNDVSAFGEGRVSLRIRGIDLVGFETFKSEYDTSAFDQRMKVTLAKKPAPFETRRITTTGFDTNQSGVTNISFGQYFIRPDGNSDQFRKGGYHA